LPTFDAETSAERYAYGARSLAAVYGGDLLHEEVPALSSTSGNLDIVAIAGRPGVLSKVAIRARDGVPAPIAVGLGSDLIPLAEVPDPE